jgi:hypothetical protein
MFTIHVAKDRFTHLSTVTRQATFVIMGKSILALLSASVELARIRRWGAFTLLASTFIYCKAIFTVHITSCKSTPRNWSTSSTSTCIATIMVLQIAIWTMECTNNVSAARLLHTMTGITTIGIFLEAMLTIDIAQHWRTTLITGWCRTSNSTRLTLTCVATIRIFSETLLTMQIAHHWKTIILALRTSSACTNITAICIFLKAMFTMHHAHEIWTSINTLADLAASLVSLVAILTIHPAS